MQHGLPTLAARNTAVIEVVADSTDGFDVRDEDVCPAPHQHARPVLVPAARMPGGLGPLRDPEQAEA
ncbi:hypothetical protein [Streptomyces sp. NPDC102437]|uniref:hypothetical protein n=1 Tax=Streptomyces sp. NPDC102437 TaxID=3366175 RepID=UPI00382FA3AF